MPIELGGHAVVREFFHGAAVDYGSVETAYDVEVYGCGVFGVVDYVYAGVGLSVVFEQVYQLEDCFVEDGAFSHTVYSAEYVHVAVKSPDDVFFVVPQ